MSYFPRRLSRRGPGRVSYDPSEPLPPEPASDTERERVLDERWRYYDMLDAQAAGDCDPGYEPPISDATRAFIAQVTSVAPGPGRHIPLVDEYDADERGLMSEEREAIVAGTDE